MTPLLSVLLFINLSTEKGIQLPAKAPLGIPYSSTLLSSCPSLQRLLAFSPVESMQCQKEADALFHELSTIRFEYSADGGADVKPTRKQSSLQQRKAKLLAESDARLLLIVPGKASRIGQIRTQLSGESSQLLGSEIVAMLSMDDKQVKAINEELRQSLFRSRDQYKNGDRSNEKRAEHRYDDHTKLLNLLSAQQAELWKKQVGERLSKEDYVKIDTEYQQKYR